MKWQTGQVAAATGSAAALTTTPTEVFEVVLKAPVTNAAAVFIGPSGVTTATGYALDPGESTVLRKKQGPADPTIDVDPTQIFVAGTTGDKLTWLAFLA